jgi:hypothetical protein
MNRIERRLTDALAARASAVNASSIRPLPAVAATRRLRRPDPTRTWFAPVAAAVSIALIATGADLMSGHAPGPGPGASPVQPAAQTASFHGEFLGVDALSAADAWAVGLVAHKATSVNDSGLEPLIMHWNGTKWQRTVALASPGGGVLTSISGTSPDDLWAAGYWLKTSTHPLLPLIAHWNGKRWQPVRFAADASYGLLLGVSVRSSTDAWAVGQAAAKTGPLILHWNGRTWQQLASRAAGPGGFLSSVTAVSAKDAWAVGIKAGFELILHWNGSAWKPAPAPASLHQHLSLYAVAAIPVDGVWAVGVSQGGQSASRASRIIRWNGSAWHAVPGPSLPVSIGFHAIAASSPGDLWVAGGGFTNGSIVHWNGTKWSDGLTHALHGNLHSLSVTSSRDAWAVGGTEGDLGAPLIVHWNGATWKKVFS